jgi:predicted ribosomally synthesized peptide with SipW-like signal peptide
VKHGNCRIICDLGRIMNRLTRKAMAAVVFALMLGLAAAGTAAAWTQEVSAGGPPWTLENLNADKVEVSIKSIDGKLAMFWVTVTLKGESGTSTYKRPVNVMGPNPARLTAQQSGSKVDKLVFTCTTGTAQVEVTGYGGGY